MKAPRKDVQTIQQAEDEDSSLTEKERFKKKMTTVKSKLTMTKTKSQPKAIPLSKFKGIATSSFSLEDDEDEAAKSGSNSSAKRRKKLLSISEGEEHSDGEATPKSKPLDGFGDAYMTQKPVKRRGSIHHAQTAMLEETSNGSKLKHTFDVKVDIRPVVKIPDNKVTPF